MNQEEDIPTRVTRGALRRRSVDQEATPQKPSTTPVGGTPKKSNSTTKRVSALNPIQESEGRPSTPIAGRTGRRRISETIDTPTSLPNKMVQNLKEAETGSEIGKRSRNASLTEENLKELNVAYEGSSVMFSTRSRTPARVRASHENLHTSGSPLTVTPAVRRSTRRNSVTSDDGNISVQSLPITTPKAGAGLRALKDDAIIEEDAGDDRAESFSSEPSTRHMRSQSVLSLMSAPASPRSTTASPVLAVKHESTPPRTITAPRVSITPRSLSKKSPHSKNVSFADNSKQNDTQSSFPKTPTSVSKEVFIMVSDLRNTDLKGVSPKADAVIDLSPKVVEIEKQEPAVNPSPKGENVESDKEVLGENADGTDEDKMNASSAIVVVQHDESTVEKANDNEVSGIDVLESSLKEVTDTASDVNQKANQSLSEINKFPKSWTSSVRGSATKAIDEYTVSQQEEQERLEKPEDSSPKTRKDSSFKASSPAAEQPTAEETEEKEDDDEEDLQQRNEFVDDEALEVEGYQSGDSMDEELRGEIQQNEIPDQGEDLGSEDTEEYDEDDKEDEDDSWIVSDGNEMDEDQLLRSSTDDLTTNGSASPKKTTLRRRNVTTILDSDEEEEKVANDDVGTKSSPSKSPKSTTSSRRSSTPVSALQISDNETVEKPMVASVEKSPTPTTPSKKIALNSPVKLSSTKKQRPEELVEAAASAKEDEATESSLVMFEDANEVKEDDPQKDKDTESSASLSTSPKKSTITRKSLPADAASLTEPHAVADVRKSLPANTKMSVSEKNDFEEGEKMPENDKNESKEEVINLEQIVEVETSIQDIKEKNESSSSQITLEQPVNEVAKPDRKSMPPISIISAQFYIGAKKRNTVGGGESSMLTSTPKPNDSSAATNKKNKSVVQKMNSPSSNSVVPNPFALANGTKLKSRVSLDTVTAVKQNAKKSRLSLPTKFIEEDLPTDTETGVNGSQEPEPMEVDEVIEEEAVVNEAANKANDDREIDDDGDDDDVSVQEVQLDEKQRTKLVKPKPKALEDYDLTNILVRCNEVLREDKERKKQLASVLRKKKEEKKRLRELEKQEELEAAKIATNSSADNDADPNKANVSTGNDSTGQGEEPTKKKKKRKPKVKNYVLEELAETKKQRMEQALRHQLEKAERRKQRKKNRQLEKKKQLDKENGDTVSVTGGIGTKLEKMKKKNKAKANGAVKAPKEDESKDPPVRVALSAYAVFNELQNNPNPLSAVDGKQKHSTDPAQLVVSPVEKKQQLKKSSNKEKQAAEPIDKAVDNQTEKQLPSSSVHKTLNADDAAVGKKKQQLAVQSEEDPLVASNKANPPILQSASDGAMSKKQKRKQAMTSASEGLENVQQSVLSAAHKISVDRVAKLVEVKVPTETEPYSNGENPKENKKKKELVAAQTSNDADSGNPKHKKNKKVKLNDAAEFFRAKLANVMDENHPEEEEVRKVKKLKKKEENGFALEDGGNVTELSRKKATAAAMEPSIVPTKKRKREQQGDSSAATTPRPAKHTKLRVLQRIESGGFFVENVTPDKVRLKRNFGFQERPATPAKQLGFKVTSLLPTGQDELRGMAASSKMYSKDGRKKSKSGGVIGPERSLSLPLPVWTSSGVFLESVADGFEADSDKKTQKEKPGYIQPKSKGKGEFNVKTLRPGGITAKPHRVDPTTIDKSVLNLKRQQLLEETAHLREKKKN